MPDDLNYSALRLLWDILQSIGVLALLVWNIIDKKRQQNSEGINGLVESHKKLDRRIQKLEDTQAHLPTHQDLTAIKVQVAGLTKQIEGMDNKLETIHQFLLNTKRSEP